MKNDDHWKTELREHLKTRYPQFPEERFSAIFEELTVIIAREKTVNFSITGQREDLQQMMVSSRVFFRQHSEYGIY